MTTITQSVSRATQEKLSTSINTENCLNCGALQMGKYCHSCGQRFEKRQLTSQTLMRWFARDIFSLEQGLLHTVKELTLRPGITIQRYISGQRKQFTNPFTYLFLWIGVSLLIFSLFGDYLQEYLVVLSSGNVSPTLPIFNEVQAQKFVETQLQLQSYSPQLTLITCIPFALFLGLFFRKRKNNLAELFVFTLFTSGHASMVVSIIGLFILPLQVNLYTYITTSFLIMTLICGLAGYQFFGRKFFSIVKVILAQMISYLIFGLIQFYGLMVYVLLSF